MAIELLILSGSRQGETIRFARSPVVIGGAKSCDVAFPQQDPGVESKRAQLTKDEYGWELRNLGEGDWFVNQSIVPTEGATPLRSGDIVRMSELGPDLRFAIVAENRPLPARVKPLAAQAADGSPPTNARSLVDDDDEDDALPEPMFRHVAAPNSAWPVVIIATGIAILIAAFLVLQNYLDERAKTPSGSRPSSTYCRIAATTVPA